MAKGHYVKRSKRQRSRLIDRHPWALVQPQTKCAACLRLFKQTPFMEKLCQVCQK